ncbi:hypothetical protein GGR58DRAFT_504213 [Xylaria digitata]|nr:hypothetical protein GGR58DRAFT_504213 [Xylaria digitata]
MPGWPTVPGAHFHKTDVVGRHMTGLETDSFNIYDVGVCGDIATLGTAVSTFWMRRDTHWVI